MRAIQAFLLVPALAGCALEASEDVATTEQDIVGGYATTGRPEVGIVKVGGGCTGTLISTRVVITASHCLSPAYTGITPPAGSYFQLTDIAGGVHYYAIDRAITFNPQADVALVHLTTAVPANLAVPTTVSAYPPAFGAQATAIGYGCNSRVTETGWGTKRFALFAYGTPTNVLCPGDSGGPAVFGYGSSSGAIWGINDQDPNPDEFAPVWLLKSQIDSAIRSWDDVAAETNLDRPGFDYASLTATSTQQCSTSCDDDPVCRAWTWVPPSTCYLKNGSPEPIPNPGVTSGLAHAAQVGYDRPGYDYTTITGMVDVTACTQACEQDYQHCKAYAYVPSTKQCWLKDRVPAAYPNAGVTSGVFDRWFDVGFDRPGGDLRLIATATANDCGWQCSLDSQCKGFVWGSSTGSCWLKQTVYPEIVKPGYTSGVRRGMKQNAAYLGFHLASIDLYDPLWTQTPETSSSTASAFACASKCNQYDGCDAWNFQLQDVGGTCELVSAFGQPLVPYYLPHSVTGLREVDFAP